VQDPLEVSRGLEEIAALLRVAEAPKFKRRAYEQAAAIVQTLGEELGPIVEQGRLRALQGIGKALSGQIEELWNTGSSEYLMTLRRAHPAGAAELVHVQGMTPKRIRALHAALGIGSVEDLLAACAAGRVREVRGFGAKTEARLCAACERWLARGNPSPRSMLYAYALDLAEVLRNELGRVALRAHLAGALRRGEELVNEIELVIDGDIHRALDHLSTLRQVLRVDPASAVAHLTGGLLLKLHGAAGSRGRALWLATGNDAHVAGVRARATRHGVDLEHGVFEGEQELYRALGLAFVPPELRHGQGEIEEAARCDFADLLELDDLRGLVHCHTTYSDGRNNVEEMARAAHALGMEYLTITDHSPSAHYARGVSLDRLKMQWEEIAAVSERVPIRILRGTESDILSDGSLDYPDSVLEQFDLIVASIHARHRMDRAAMTERLKRALSIPVFKIWGHALGRILNHRAPIDCDVEAVLDAIARSPGAIEVNADPHRLDLPPSWIPHARARKIPFVVSADAHSTAGFGVLRYGVTMARRGGLRKREVLNTESSERFAALVRPIAAVSGASRRTLP
jgi:DNA polymerase (family 10)